MSKKENVHSIYLSIRNKLAHAVSRIVPPKEIEDIVQETYVRVCQVEKKSVIRHPRSFLLKTARNLALDYIKQAETRLTQSMEDDPAQWLSEAEPLTDETFNRVAADEEFSHFCEAARQLPVQCRRAFVLKKVYGYSQREIAKSLGISESTVEKHIGAGIKRCTQIMLQRTGQGNTLTLGNKCDSVRNMRSPGTGGDV
jgi:RNA polymerase sigma factor (sigma-70 family)